MIIQTTTGITPATYKAFKTFISFISPDTSEIIILYENKHYTRGIIIDNIALNAVDYSCISSKKKNKFIYLTGDNGWQNGTWLTDKNNIIRCDFNNECTFFKSDTQYSQLHDMETNQIFHSILRPDLINEILIYRHVFYDREIIQSNEIIPAAVTANDSDKILYKNLGTAIGNSSTIYTGMRWLYASLYCARGNWSCLLSKAVRPFILNTYHEDFVLKFDYTRGANIRLALLLPGEQFENTAQSMNNYFGAFFDKNSAIDDAPHFINDLFMPSVKNTIRYGLYDLDVLNTNSKLRHSLSDIMIEAFADHIETLDDESILTVALYLSVALINSTIKKGETLNFKKQALHNHLLSFYSNWYNRTNEIIPAYNFDIIYFDNEKEIVDIANSISSPSNFDDAPWLGKWIKTCEEVTSGDIEDIEALMKIHNKTVFLTYVQLGITEYMRHTIFYFIKNLLANQLLSK